MQSMWWVGIGGFVGAIARYRLSAWCAANWGAAAFPWPTLLVNVLGCLAAGGVAAWTLRWPAMPPEVRLLVMTGLLGGFTTFSAFSVEALALLRRGDGWLMVLYATASVVLGLLAAGVGFKLVSWGR